MIKVIPFIYKDSDDLFANTYVVIDECNKCFVVDPGADYDGILNYIKNNKLICQGVLLTHTHFDHMRGVDRIVKVLNVPLYVDFYDIPGLEDPNLNCSSFFEKEIIVSSKPISITDNVLIEGLKEKILVIETPYHTVGSVCFYLEDSGYLFSGDSLFKLSIGRDDLPSSIPHKKKTSLEKIFTLPDNVKVYPGHGRFTTIKEERELNPFVKL